MNDSRVLQEDTQMTYGSYQCHCVNQAGKDPVSKAPNTNRSDRRQGHAMGQTDKKSHDKCHHDNTADGFTSL
jgi:hypothetical protein